MTRLTAAGTALTLRTELTPKWRRPVEDGRSQHRVTGLCAAILPRGYFPPGPESAFVGRSLTSRVLWRQRHSTKLAPANRGGKAEVVRPPGEVTILPRGRVRFLQAASGTIPRLGNSVTSDVLCGGYWGRGQRCLSGGVVPLKVGGLPGFSVQGSGLQRE